MRKFYQLGYLLVYGLARFLRNPVLQFAYSSWITKAVSKTIDCLIFSSNHILQHFSLNFNPLSWITVSLNPLSHWWHGQTLFSPVSSMGLCGNISNGFSIALLFKLLGLISFGCWHFAFFVVLVIFYSVALGRIRCASYWQLPWNYSPLMELNDVCTCQTRPWIHSNSICNGIEFSGVQFL